MTYKWTTVTCHLYQGQVLNILLSSTSTKLVFYSIYQHLDKNWGAICLSLMSSPVCDVARITNSILLVTVCFLHRLENLKGLVSETVKEVKPDEDDMIRSVVGTGAHCADYPHPLQESLDALVYQNRQLELGEEIRPRSMEFTKFLFVDSESLLDSMCEDLSCAEEIAVDLEHHDLRVYLGLTCLIQVYSLEIVLPC